MSDDHTEAAALLQVRNLHKTFVLHTRDGVRLPVFAGVDLDVHARECVVLCGPSGCGKSTLLRSLYANYLPSAGAVRVRHDGRWVDLVSAAAREVLDVRARTLGYVSQFLRVIPRIPTREVVAATLAVDAIPRDAALTRAEAMLNRVNIPQRLWHVPPATFSGGEQQRVNIARCFVRDFPVLLLDEPTASLDPDNRAVVLSLIEEARARGSAIVAICHDAELRDAMATRLFDVERFRAAA